MGEYQGQSVGWGPLKSDWYSFCSAHREFDKDCQTCSHGSYVNRLSRKLSAYVHKHHYGLWYWWKNRPKSDKREFYENYSKSDNTSLKKIK